MNKNLSFFAKSLNWCEKCNSLVSSRNLIVLGHGDPQAKLMFVGMAPGRNGADITGIPFTKDPSGVLFQECMIHAGYSLENNPKCEHPHLKDVYVTNLIKCNPKDENGNNRTPSVDEIENCVPHFQKEIDEINPEIVVLFGKVVSEYILKQRISKFNTYHNKPITMDNRVFVPFIHPSYVIRGAYNREKYINEINELKKFLKKR
jgi:uracil-DNA glycosylase family 4